MNSKSKILIVDDEEPVREVICEGLTAAGYDCSTASNYTEALNVLKNDSVNLVLSDINMPGESGIQLLRAAKEYNDDIEVIMVTGVIDIDIAIHAMRLGASDYIAKPFNFEEMKIVIEKALDKRRLILENREYQLNLERKVQERTTEIVARKKEIEQLYSKLSIAFHQISETYNATLESLIVALDARDSETRGHSKRVVEYTTLIAERMEVASAAIVNMRRGALLHDIGKIGIPDAILLKPGKLSEEEWVIMKKHPEIGYRMLNGIKFLEESMSIVLHHHERWDGSGYPSQLRGEAIPLGARIFAIVDTFDAMTSSRPYRNALTYEDVCSEVEKFQGKQFDPLLSRLFLSIPKNEWESINTKILAQMSVLQKQT